MRLAVAGGTGRLGRRVAEAAQREGHEVVILARSAGIDLITGSGLSDALSGVEVVVDAAGASVISAKDSIAFFTTATKNLLAAEERAGVGHHVAISIVGVDRAPVGYYAGKRAQEQVIEAGPVAWTILRATQFHEFVVQAYDLARLGPIHVAPKMRTQPVAAREVAARLVALAGGVPSGAILELGGPREESLVDMVRAYARAHGSKAWIPPVRVPGAFGRAQRDGSLLPGSDAELGIQTFADWVRQLSGSAEL